MCRSIRTLFPLDPPPTEDEIRAAAVQFVRKISGYNKPSRANEPAFLQAVAEITATSKRLIGTLTTKLPAKVR